MSKPRQSPPKFDMVRSDDFTCHYANHASVGLSTTDFTLIFGQTVPTASADRKKDVIHEELLIRMSLPFAKYFSRILERNIRQHEEKFGEILLPAVFEADISPPPDSGKS